MDKEFTWRSNLFRNLPTFKKYALIGVGGFLPLIVLFPISLFVLPLLWLPLLYPFKFTLNSEGITRMKRITPWNEIEKVSISGNTLIIYTEKGQSKIPIKSRDLAEVKNYLKSHNVKWD